MAGNIRDSNYYRQRAAAIRARGGDERLARTMQNYADLYDAGIYNDNSAPVQFGNMPQQAAVPAQPVGKSSGGSQKQKVADAPSKYVSSAAIAQHFSQAPEYDVDTYRTNYEPSPLGTADFKRMNDTNTIGASDLLPQKDAYMDLPTYELPPMEVTAEAPKQESSPQKKFQLVGTKPGGGSALTEYYASQLRYVPYENNKGVNGVKYGSSGLVNRMRDLCQIVPYNETDGTNCARTVSAALDGTPYSGMYNVDQMIETAARQGQLRDAYGDYKPKA